MRLTTQPIQLFCSLAALVIVFIQFNYFSMRTEKDAKNVLGTKLESCCTDPMTGYYRDGSCHTGLDDTGSHVVCAIMTREFLDYTKSRGNDLCTPLPAYNFPGLNPGDKWCLCALRWKEAMQAGKAPKVELSATHEKALQFVSLKELKQHAVGEVKK